MNQVVVITGLAQGMGREVALRLAAGGDVVAGFDMDADGIAELQKEYKGRASIIFIDVWEHREQAQRFGIRGIPTQIFYDKEGKEVGRHVGFLNKKSIVATFEKLGVPNQVGQ